MDRYQTTLCRKAQSTNTTKEIIESLPFEKGTSIFFFAKVLLGDKTHAMTNPVYLVGFKAGGKSIISPQIGRTLQPNKSPSSSRLDGLLKHFLPGGNDISKSITLSQEANTACSTSYWLVLSRIYFWSSIFIRTYDKVPSLRLLRQLRWDIRHEALPETRVHISCFLNLEQPQFSPLGFATKLHAIF